MKPDKSSRITSPAKSYREIASLLLLSRVKSSPQRPTPVPIFWSVQGATSLVVSVAAAVSVTAAVSVAVSVCEVVVVPEVVVVVAVVVDSVLVVVVLGSSAAQLSE